MERNTLTFLDSEKSSDSLARDVTGQVLKEYKVPKKTISMIKTYKVVQI
jgi:hypothetical protein